MSELDVARRPRALLLCFCCSPVRGSEAAVGWNRAIQAARFCNTWVICPDGAMGEEIRAYLRTHGPIPGLTFVFLPLSPLFHRFGNRTLVYYFFYRRWQRRAAELVRQLHAEIGFDLVHLVNVCGYREPGHVWQQDVPFIWGPWGGTSNFPPRFLRLAGIKGATVEVCRTLINRLQLRFSRRVAGAARRAALLLATSSACRRDFLDAGHPEPRLAPCNGIADTEGEPRRWTATERPFRLLWSGRLEPIKGLPLLLRALTQLAPEVSWELRILGDGPERQRLERLARRLGVDARITWLGWRQHREALEQYRWADAFVFTSLRDNFPTVVLEALAAALPVVCLDHQGVADIVTGASGIKVAVEEPRQTVADLAAALTSLSRDRERWEALSAGAQARARTFLWSRLGEQMAEFYREVSGTRTLHSTAPLESRCVLGVEKEPLPVK